MLRGIKLSEFEKGQTTAYHEANKSNREIARLMGRSLDLVNRFVKNPEEYGIIKRTGLQISFPSEISTEFSELHRIPPPHAAKSRKIWALECR